MNCIFYALYLPDLKKKYVVEDFFERVKVFQKNSVVYVGIQHNSIIETEEIVRKLKGNLQVRVARVTKGMEINSDASAFIAALELYSKELVSYNFCYFTHSKSITTGNNQLRTHLYDYLFKNDLSWSNAPNIGSWGQYITCLPNNCDEIKKMFWMNLFGFQCQPLNYFYTHTMFIIKGNIVRKFISDVNSIFFNTPISTYSDRYFFERDFIHICDIFGYKPYNSQLVGNFHTNFVPPSLEAYKRDIGL